MSDKKDKCEICGKGLVYVTNTEESKDLKCYYCGKEDLTNTYCPDNHYICSSCHASAPIKLITKFCQETDLKNPFEIADKIMAHPKFKLYGPEHHVLTPAAILTALKNNGIQKPNGMFVENSDIVEAIRRGSKIPGGWCGFYGSCGAGMGSGIAISVFTGATPSTNEPRTLANTITSRSLKRISDNLEHCCKRSVRLAILETLNFLRERFEIDLRYLPDKCIFSGVNDKCERENCPIF